MTTVAEMIHRAKEIRERLIHPPNAVEDIGIDLKRKPKPPKPAKEAAPVLEHHIAFCRVSILTNALPTTNYKPLKFIAIVQFVAADFGITVPELMGEGRQFRLTLPRHVACHLGFKHTGMSMAAIGRRLNKDHTTIIHAIRRIQERMARDPGLAAKVSVIEDKLLSLPYDWQTHSAGPSLAAESERDLAIWKETGLPESQIQQVGHASRSAGESLPVSNDNGPFQSQDHPESTH